jgi:hypothetical protein
MVTEKPRGLRRHPLRGDHGLDVGQRRQRQQAIATR